VHKKAGDEVVCALKIISKKKLAENEIYEKLIENELNVLATANHPNIMRVYELLQDDFNYYIVTEFLEGGELMGRLTGKK
jgi:calcium-dependent protein kinase